MVWQDYISLFSGPIGIAATAIVAVYIIRKTAEESRISNIHTELVGCLVDTVHLIEQVLALLNDIANHVVYRTVPGEEVTETAYRRYWREIGELSKQFRVMQAKQRLVFPRKLYEYIQDIVARINEARNLGRHATPDKDHIYPDTRELRTVVDQAITTYRNFLHESRKYLGTDKLEPISLVSELPIKAKEDEQPVADA